MIKITDVEIENFRSIIGKSLDFTIKDYTVIVGPNNTGKSNILRAIQLFLSGHVDGKPYDSNIDFPKIQNPVSVAQTRITMTFKYSPSVHPKIESTIKEIEKELGSVKLESGGIKIRQNFSRRNSESWQIITRKGIRSVKPHLIIPLVNAIRSSIKFKYLPVGRNVTETIAKELSHDLISTIFRSFSGAVKTRKKVNELITKLISELQPELENTGDELAFAMTSVFQEIKKLRLHLPFHDLNTLLPTLIPDLQDSYATAIEYKGAGLQTSSLIFFLKYLADHHPQRHNARITYIWAIEEPESFLHPEKQRSVAKVLEDFSKSVQTLVTTHSPHFLSRKDHATISVIQKNTIAPFSTRIQSNKIEDAKSSLGISLLDSMFVFPKNVVVEGPSDEILLRTIWTRLHQEQRLKTSANDIKFWAAGGVKQACDLYYYLTNFDLGVGTKIVLVSDGDAAAKGAVSGLQSRLKQLNRTISANKDYFQLEFDIEWLFHVDMMEKLVELFPSQVKLQENTENAITDFKIEEGHKVNIATYVAQNSTINQLGDFEKVLLKLDKVFCEK